jgi:hypothetical protein
MPSCFSLTRSGWAIVESSAKSVNTESVAYVERQLPLQSQRTLMRKMSIACFLLLGLLGVGRIVCGPSADSARTARAAEPVADIAPVESDMHEFMEYVFEPPYKRLKPLLAGESIDKAGWKSIKSDSLILAEACNLLNGRTAEKEVAEWNAHAKKVRESGSALYTAAKKKDTDEAKKQWAGMLENCNACHKQFAGGEHMLQP